MIKFSKILQLRDQTDCLQSCFGKVLGGAIMKYKLKDPGSAITHGIAFLLAAVGAAPLLIRSSEWSDHIQSCYEEQSGTPAYSFPRSLQRSSYDPASSVCGSPSP